MELGVVGLLLLVGDRRDRREVVQLQETVGVVAILHSGKFNSCFWKRYIISFESATEGKTTTQFLTFGTNVGHSPLA